LSVGFLRSTLCITCYVVTSSTVRT